MDLNDEATVSSLDGNIDHNTDYTPVSGHAVNLGN